MSTSINWDLNQDNNEGAQRINYVIQGISPEFPNPSFVTIFAALHNFFKNKTASLIRQNSHISYFKFVLCLLTVKGGWLSKNIEFKGVYYDRQCKYSTNRNNICLVTRLHSNQFKGIPPPPKKNSLDNDFMITKIVSYNHTYKMGDFGLIFFSQIILRAHGLQKCAFLGVFHKTVYRMILQIYRS